MDTIKTGKITHDNRGRFAKGTVSNPKGRPRKPEITILRDALIEAKKEHGLHLIEHAVKWAYKDPKILIAILKKLLPDKIEGTGLTNDTKIMIVIPKERIKEFENRT